MLLERQISIGNIIDKMSHNKMSFDRSRGVKNPSSMRKRNLRKKKFLKKTRTTFSGVVFTTLHCLRKLRMGPIS